jgi:nucleoside-diphosphate-sugar epimerase
MPGSPGILLTGATGLLGRYLLRDLLAAGKPVAVLARDAGGRSAQERIAELVACWSDALGRPLPRPVVLSGILGPDGPGLSAADRRWLGRRCQAVLHAAASLSFRATLDGEPWRTNVEGTQALLRLCTAAGIAEWHHVSTAFVCGRRTGTILEDELDCGQAFYNPYEHSKHEAERCLRAAPGLRLTVYRPSVIVGDSATGHTSSYAGIYRFLELADRLADAHTPAGSGAQCLNRQLPLRLPLTGAELTNLVPVDWVARAIRELAERPAWRGGTYHLVARAPVPSRLLHRLAVEELNVEGFELGGPDGCHKPSRLEELFREGLTEYWPYLGGCPDFSWTNTARALPELPPLAVDEPLLRRLIRFALGDRWGRREPQPRSTPVSGAQSFCADYLERIFPPQARQSRLARHARLTVRVSLSVRGPGGGQWSCRWSQGELDAVVPGLDERADVTYHTDPATFEAVVRGRQTPQEAFFEQRITISGDLETALKLAVLFAQFLGENPYVPSQRKEALHAKRSA